MMKDHINIKAINQAILWNQSIAELMDKVSYTIDFDDNQISLFINRGFFDNKIEFNRCEFGRYRMDNINDEYFNQLSLDLITEETEVSNHIMNWRNNTNIVKYGGGKKLDIIYSGNNTKRKSQIVLNSDKEKFSLEETINWSFEIQQIRKYLSHEFHNRHYDYNYNKEIRYQWIVFKELNLFGLTNLKFRGYYNPIKKVLLKLEAIIGNEISDYHQTQELIRAKIGDPIETSTPKYNRRFHHTFLKDIWQINDLIIETKSKIIPRSDTMGYEVEIMKN